MFDLQRFALMFFAALIISDLDDDPRNCLAESSVQFLLGGIRVLCHVMKKRRAQHYRLGYSSLIGQYPSKCKRVIDVRRRLRVLYALHPVFVCCEGKRVEQLRYLVH
jgi:hypothetical protein